MNSFVLDRVECKLAAFKGDGETHGDREKKCVDLTLTITGDYTILALVERDLIDALTKVANPEDAAGELFEGGESSVRRIQRFPKLEQIALDIECVGREVIVEHGIDDKSAIRLIGCTLNKFRVMCEPGARFTIKLHLRAFPEQRQTGLLWSKIHETAIVSVLPPAQKVLSIDEAKAGDGATPAPAAESAAPEKKSRGGRKAKLSVVDGTAPDAKADGGQAFPDAIDGTGKGDGWPFATRPDGDGAGVSE